MINVVNRHTYSGSGIYIGRGTIWGNKASHLAYPGVEVVTKTREEAIAWYKEWLRNEFRKGGPIKKELLKLVEKHKRGEPITLICSCAPKACHGHVIRDAILALAKAY